MYVFASKSVAETQALGKALGSVLAAGDIVCLSGDLGAGKTAFVQGVAAGMGINDYVTSPTYTLINEYPGRIPLYHMDVYRLGDIDELADLGFEEYLDGSGVVLIEWADLIAVALPRDVLWVEIAVTGDETRNIKFVPHGARAEILLKEMVADVNSRA